MSRCQNERTSWDSSRGQDGLSRPQRSILMRVVDTSAWLEWLVGPLLAESSAPELPRTILGCPDYRPI